METKWLGLWAQERQGFYSGQVIKKSDIPKYTRIILRYNKYYEKNGNRPRFVYCFADSEGYESKCVPIEYEDSLKAKVDRLSEILNLANHNADKVSLPSESQAQARTYMDEAIGIIEEMTGAEWSFPYTSWV